jgi:spermidine/putrescine transport system substrate-binding protein
MGRWIRSATLATTVAVVLAACGGGGDAGGDAGNGGVPLEDQTLTISNWDAYTPEGLIEAFEEETGVDVTLALHTTNEDLVGKIQAAQGGGFDLVFISGNYLQTLIDQGWAAELDHDLIPNLANLYPEANELGYDPGNRYSVPYTWGTTGICYRSDLVEDEPTSWTIFHDPPVDLVGKMTMLGTNPWLLEPALRSLGSSLNTTDPAEIDAATRWTIEAKENLKGFDDTTFYSELVAGNTWLAQAWDGWCNYGIAEDPNIRFVVPEEGSDLWTDTMVILASSENKEAAHAFIDFVLRPENGKAVAELVYYKVPNRAAMEQLDPKLLEQFPNLGIPPSELLTYESLRDPGEAISLWTDAAAKIKSA